MRSSTTRAHLEEKAVANHGGITGGGPKAALDDALGVLSGAFNLAIRALPFVALALLAWFAVGAVRRRRPEAAFF